MLVQQSLLPHQGFYSKQIIFNSQLLWNNHSFTNYFFLHLYYKLLPFSQRWNMLSVLQMSKLNHMANKFDLFLKDIDLNKKFLLWNKLNFTTKEVGEVRKQFFPHIFSWSAQQWHSQFQDEEVLSYFFCLKHVPSGELAIIQTDESCSPFLCEAKHQKWSRSQHPCSTLSLSQHKDSAIWIHVSSEHVEERNVILLSSHMRNMKWRKFKKKTTKTWATESENRLYCTVAMLLLVRLKQ